jgi:hypothetical protein
VQKRLIPKVIGTHAKLDWVGHRWISRKLGWPRPTGLGLAWDIGLTGPTRQKSLFKPGQSTKLIRSPSCGQRPAQEASGSEARAAARATGTVGPPMIGVCGVTSYVTPTMRHTRQLWENNFRFLFVPEFPNNRAHADARTHLLIPFTTHARQEEKIGRRLPLIIGSS